MNLNIGDCRGQCYDGATNMSGARNGAATQITAALCVALVKTSGSFFPIIKMNADLLELLNLPDLAPIIHKWQKAKSLVAS